MRKSILLLTFLLSNFAAADAITEACNRDVPRETVNQVEHNKPGVERSNVRAAIAGGIPKVEYAVQTNTAVCIADKIFLALKDTSNFYAFCPSVTSGLRIDCFNAWLKTQDSTYAAQVAQYAVTAYALAELDMRTSKKKGIALVKLFDSLLLPLEKYSTTKNVAYRFETKNIQERMKLREQETRDFMVVKASLLSRVEGDLGLLKRAAVRKPAASHRTAGEWRAELVSRQLKKRLAKLKNF